MMSPSLYPSQIICCSGRVRWKVRFCPLAWRYTCKLLQYETIFPICDGLNISVAAFYSSVPSQWMCTLDHKCMSQLLANFLKCLQVKAVSLSVNISIGGPCSKKIISIRQMTLVASCWCNDHHIANPEALQSMSFRKCPLLICFSCSPHPVSFYSNELVLDLLSGRLWQPIWRVDRSS